MSTFVELLNKLPDVSFAEKDTAVIEAEVISFFEEALNEKLYDGDPIRNLLLGFVKYLSLQRSYIDFTGKQNLLKYALEAITQHLGALVGVEISEPVKAVTKLKFTLSTALTFATAIPKGTRATRGDKIYFATTEDIIIPAGELWGIAAAECTEAGTIGNGYYPGQINQLSDPFPYNLTVENTELTDGGADRESLISLKERIWSAPESFSTAGPKGAYKFWAKTASTLIADVSVASPSPGVVEIIPLLNGGETPSQSVLDKVYDICSDENRRPLTEQVLVRAPETVSYIAVCTYYISRSDSTSAASLLDKVNAAAGEYELWQKAALGRDINPSKLVEKLMGTGVKRVEVLLEHRKLKYYQVAVADEIKIEYGGLEDD